MLYNTGLLGNRNVYILLVTVAAHNLNVFIYFKKNFIVEKFPGHPGLWSYCGSGAILLKKSTVD